MKINRVAKIRFELYEYQPIKVMERHLTNLTEKRRQVTKRIINPQERKAKTFSQKRHECDSVSSQNRLSVAHDSQGFCSIGECILVLQQVEERGYHAYHLHLRRKRHTHRDNRKGRHEESCRPDLEIACGTVYRIPYFLRIMRTGFSMDSAHKV